MEIRWLQDFLTLVETGNFTRAAQARCVSQPAFSRRIKQLENWLGMQLVDRTTFPIQLTVDGAKFQISAREILHQAFESRQKFSQHDFCVRIGVPYALATTRFPEWWGTWSGGDVTKCFLELGYVPDLITSLEAGAIDIVIGYENALKPICLESSVFDRVIVEKDRLRPFGLADFAIEFDWLKKSDRTIPLLMYPSSVYFGQLVPLIIERATRPPQGNCVVESEMTDVLRSMAIAGHGVAWLPEKAKLDAERTSLVAVDDGSWSVDLTIVAFSKRSNRSPLVDQVWTRISQSLVSGC